MAGNIPTSDLWKKVKPLVPSVILLITIIFISLVRFRLLQVPLERDEGEFAYFGQLILRGIPPYSLAYSLKFPGVFYAYALIMQVFGQSIEGIRLGLLVVNVITIVLLFLIGKNLYDEYTGIAASTSYAIMSLSPSVFGLFSHATHFVMVFVLGGLLLFIKIIKNNRSPVYYLLCGVFFGMAFTMKQHAVFFVLFPLIYLLMAGIKEKPGSKVLLLRAIYYFLGTILPLMAISLYLYLSGVFDKFWFWTFEYAREYVSEIPVEIGVKYFISNTLKIIIPSIFLWLLAGVGILLLFMRKEQKDKGFIIIYFLICSILAIFPGFYFREHYYVMLLPAICMLTGISVGLMKVYIERYKISAFSWVFSLVIFLGAIMHALYYDRNYFFFDTIETVTRAMSGDNPFPESLIIAKYVEENTSLNDRILVLGSEPQIYFYSRRISATGHIYMYGLMENQKYARSMQREMIREAESANPIIIVVVTVMKSWLIRPSSDTTILEWGNRFAMANYELVGVADNVGSDDVIFLWNSNAVQYTPRTDSVIYIFKKKRVN